MTYVYLEAASGKLVRVPIDKVKEWQKAQDKIRAEKKKTEFILEKWTPFYEESKRGVEPTAADIRAPYGIKEEHMPHGAAGTFFWEIPDVYISEELSKRIKNSPSYSEELREMIKRFYQDDYGFVTRDEESHNGELRYLCGDNRWMIGRYKSLYGGVVLETLYDISILYLVHEDVSDICQIQFEKFCEKYGHDCSEENGWRRNQLLYK